MAKRKDIIVLHHPTAGLEYVATDEGQAKVLCKPAQGWKRGPLPEPAKSKKDGS